MKLSYQSNASQLSKQRLRYVSNWQDQELKNISFYGYGTMTRGVAWWMWLNHVVYRRRISCSQKHKGYVVLNTVRVSRTQRLSVGSVSKVENIRWNDGSSLPHWQATRVLWKVQQDACPWSGYSKTSLQRPKQTLSQPRFRQRVTCIHGLSCH